MVHMQNEMTTILVRSFIIYMLVWFFFVLWLRSQFKSLLMSGLFFSYGAIKSIWNLFRRTRCRTSATLSLQARLSNGQTDTKRGRFPATSLETALFMLRVSFLFSLMTVLMILCCSVKAKWTVVLFTFKVLAGKVQQLITSLHNRLGYSI